MKPKNIVNLETLKFESEDVRDNFKYEVAPEALSKNMGAKKLGYNVSTLLPGQFSSPYHFHFSEEELFIVIDGSAILREPSGYTEVKKGDMIFCANSAEGAHQFYNHTKLPFKYLGLSTLDEFDVCEYPDSKKVLVRKLNKMFQADSQVDYWKDEENPEKYWPKKYL